MRIVCWQMNLMKYHTLFFSKIKISQNVLSAEVVIGPLRVNPFMPYEISRPYQLDESISNFRVVGCYF